MNTPHEIIVCLVLGKHLDSKCIFTTCAHNSYLHYFFFPKLLPLFYQQNATQHNCKWCKGHEEMVSYQTHNSKGRHNNENQALIKRWHIQDIHPRLR